MQNSITLELFNDTIIKWSRIFNISEDIILNDIINRIKSNHTIDKFSFYNYFEKPDEFFSFSKFLDSKNISNNIINDASDEYKMMYKFADFLDNSGETNKHFFLIQKEFVFTDNNNFIINPFYLSKIVVSDEMRLDEHIRKNYFYKLPFKDLTISYKVIDSQLERYAFVFFLTELLYPDLPFNDVSIDVIIKYSEIWYPEMSHNLIFFLTDVLIFKKNISYSCKEILVLFIKFILSNIKNSVHFKSVNYDVYSGTRQGRKKNNNTQSEDEYEIIRSNKFSNRYFIMVADGVSTAEIGSGKVIASLIKRNIILNKKNVIEFIENILTNDFNQFKNESNEFLRSILYEINNEATNELNIYLEKESKNSNNISNYMSSTIIVGIVIGNWAVFAYLGDSEIIFINKNYYAILNIPHIVEYEKIKMNKNKNNFVSKNSEDDSMLTKVIPLSDADDKGLFVSQIDFNKNIDFVSFNTSKDDIIIIATDGLLTCLGKGNTDRQVCLKKLYEFTLNNFNLPLNNFTKILLDKSDETSIDDVSLIIFKNTGKETPDTIIHEKSDTNFHNDDYQKSIHQNIYNYHTQPQKCSKTNCRKKNKRFSES